MIRQLAIFQIMSFFQNDRNDIISDRGWEVLNNPEMMKEVNLEIEKYRKSGRSDELTINFNNQTNENTWSKS